MERIAIVGIDNFSISLIKIFAGKVKFISAIDSDPVQVAKIQDIVDHSTIGNIEDGRTITAFLENEFDTGFVSPGKNMTASLIAVNHMIEMGIKNIYARAISEDHAKILGEMGNIEVISPEEDTAKNLLEKFTNDREL